MSIVERVQRICLSPNTEWAVIAGESATLSSLISGYVLPLAAVGAMATLAGSLMIGLGLGFAMRLAIIGVVLSVVSVVILSVVIDALAPTFGAPKSRSNAAKVAAYAPTPAWVAGWFQVIPFLFLSSLVEFIGALYALYLLYLGLMRVMKSPQDKAVGYTIVTVIIAIVIWAVVSYITSASAGFGPTFLWSRGG